MFNVNSAYIVSIDLLSQDKNKKAEPRNFCVRCSLKFKASTHTFTQINNSTQGIF